MKINVLMVAHESNINGASFSLLNLIDKLKNKCNFTIITPYERGPFVEALNTRNVKVYYVPFERWIKFKDNNFKSEQKNWKRKDNLKNQLLAKKMAKILENEKIDIIHSNTSVVDLGYRISKIMKIPHVWHIREFGEEDFSMYPLCSYRKYYKKICDKNNYIVCVSNTVKDKFSKKAKKDKIQVIYNGVDEKNINNHKKFPTKKDKIICLQTGMISKAKGQDITIKAIDLLYKEGYKNIELQLAGRGNIEDLEIENIKNKKWLKVLGQVDNINEIRKDVNIEIVSSKKEAFGRVTIEAMMGQIPVVGSNTGGTKELIKDNETGLLYESGNYEDLKEKIKYLYENRKEIKRLGENAYNYSKEYFLIDRCAKEIFELYKKIIKNR